MTSTPGVARRPAFGRRWVIIFVAALLFAIGAAGWQGWLQWRLAHPAVNATVAVGETITVAGSTYRVDRFVSADEFGNAERGEPPVRAPRGATIVLVVLTTEIVDDAVDPSTRVCEGVLVDADGRTWRVESTVTYAIKRPEAYGCSGTSEQDLRPHQPLEVGFSYVIPDDAADEVALRLSLGSRDHFLIRVER